MPIIWLGVPRSAPSPRLRGPASPPDFCPSLFVKYFPPPPAPFLYALFQAGFDEIIQPAIQDCLGVTAFDVRSQILDTRLIQHVGTDLVAPTNVCLAVFHGLFFLIALAQLSFVKARFQHGHCVGPIAMLRTAGLALHYDTGGVVGDANGRVCLVDMLTPGTGRAK